MEIGAAIFFTDYSIAPTELAVALEERGFDSLWVAEHSTVLEELFEPRAGRLVSRHGCSRLSDQRTRIVGGT